MITPAGQRDKRIGFEEGAPARSGLGREPMAEWQERFRYWAKVLFGTGAERREAGAKQASQTATFRVLATSQTRSVSEAWRIIFDGRVWDITAIAPLPGNAEIEFTAIAAGRSG